MVASLNTQLGQQNAQLVSAERITNAAAKSAATAVGGIGSAFPASIQSKAANVLVQIAYIPGLRAGAPTEQQLLAGVAAEQPVQVIDGYSGVLSILFALDNEITTGSGDVALGDDVRALSWLSQAEDQASQQRAILYGALFDSALNNAGTDKKPFNNVGGPTALGNFGGLDALITAQDLQFADQQSFQAVATTAQTQAFLNSQGGARAQNAQLIENLVTTAGDPTVIFPLAKGIPGIGYTNAATAPAAGTATCPRPSTGRGASTISWPAQIVTRSQQLQHQAFESAVVTALAVAIAVLLVLLAAALVARSMVNPLRRLQGTRWRSPRSSCPRGWRRPPAGPNWPRRTRPRSTGSSRSGCRRPTRSAASPARSTRSTPRRCGWPAPRRSCAATSTRCSSACPGAACR